MRWAGRTLSDASQSPRDYGNCEPGPGADADGTEIRCGVACNRLSRLTRVATRAGHTHLSLKP